MRIKRAYEAECGNGKPAVDERKVDFTVLEWLSSVVGIDCIMPDDFIIVPNTSKLQTDQKGQIALILHQSVQDALYRVFQSTAPLSRLTDYSHFFTVSFDDLSAHLRSHPDEFHGLLPGESWDGESVVRDGQTYTFRHHFRGLVTSSERIEGIDAAIVKWLRGRLYNQGLRKLADKSSA